MTPALLATMLLLGQAPAAPFPSAPPPPMAPAPSSQTAPAEPAPAESAPETPPANESDLTAALQAATSSASSPAREAVPSISEEETIYAAPTAAPSTSEPAASDAGPALVPIGDTTAAAPSAPATAETAALPGLALPPAAAPAAPAPAAAAPPAAFPLPSDAEPHSVLVEPLGPADDTAPTQPAADTVQPATSEQPLTSPTANRLSETVLERLLTAPESQALAGDPTQLIEAIPMGGERTRQIEAVQAYWESSLRTAVYHATLADLERLASVPAPATQRERAVFEQAVLAAEANARQAELKAVDAQYTLADKAGISIDNLLPLPTDTPLTGSYRTHYDTLFASRTAPVNLRRIDRTLPLCQRLLESRAASLVASEGVWDTELAAYERGEISLELLLVSFERLTAQRVAFLETVRRYNFDIADFALNVSTSGASRETIVSMLIETAGGPPTIRPASAAAPLPAGAAVPAGGRVSGEGVIIYGDPVQGRVIRSGPTPAAPTGAPGIVVPGGYSVPGQPSPAVRPVPVGTPMLSPTPATPTPAATPPALQPPTTSTPSPASGAAAPLPSPAEVAGPGAFRDVTPGREPPTLPATSGGELRLAQATEPATSAPAGGVQPATYAEPAPRGGRIVDTPAPPGLEGTRSVLVRP